MSSKKRSLAATHEESAVVPRLRFPEFAGHPLQDVRLADATAESTERNGAGQATSQFMGVSKVQGIVPMEERIVGADTARYKFVRKDWFVYNPMRLNIGSIARWQGDDDILVSPDYVVFKCKGAGPHRLNPAYLDHFRRSDAWEKFVSEKGDGSVRVRIYYKDLARLRLALPSFPEQQKIADGLDLADALISAQGRKVKALKAHKKGLMQQLFPQEGETQPRLRFPEFEGATEWRKATLGDLLALPATYGIVTAGSFLAQGVPMLRGGDIKEGKLAIGAPLVAPEISIQYKRTVLKLDDLVIALVGYPGEAAVVPIHYVGANISRAVGLLRLKDRRSARFIAFYLNSPVGRRSVLKPSAGSAQVVVNLKALNALVLPITEPAEQQRIADCLTSLDKVIAAESQKLDALKTHKKGLMQQLFPTVVEENA